MGKRGGRGACGSGQQELRTLPVAQCKPESGQRGQVFKGELMGMDVQIRRLHPKEAREWRGLLTIASGFSQIEHTTECIDVVCSLSAPHCRAPRTQSGTFHFWFPNHLVSREELT